ncbi:hypothetical protein [Candidatus Magnetobacterium casense]|uniref:Uncharacterized protein n=1 Tax=Candidatus Magnetobacterium casense TaxID=1455061 RepID=A0ABS6RYA8_9BACT|nr:hypothetical protein [Candidatus Magnetobacterium casensis]MBV6341213.1 hypothetical protein [Candidatus Magnetobacterium casensis]
MESLRLELGIGNEPEPVNKEAKTDDGFGLPEVIGAFALMSMAALIQVQF